MSEERKQEIVQRLEGIVEAFEPTEEEPFMSMFGLISRYNQTYDNPESIGGSWVIENVPSLSDLPPVA